MCVCMELGRVNHGEALEHTRIFEVGNTFLERIQ